MRERSVVTEAVGSPAASALRLRAANMTSLVSLKGGVRRTVWASHVVPMDVVGPAEPAHRPRVVTTTTNVFLNRAALLTALGKNAAVTDVGAAAEPVGPVPVVVLTVRVRPLVRVRPTVPECNVVVMVVVAPAVAAPRARYAE